MTHRPPYPDLTVGLEALYHLSLGLVLPEVPEESQDRPSRKLHSSGPSLCPYSPKCVEQEFSEGRNRKNGTRRTP